MRQGESLTFSCWLAVPVDSPPAFLLHLALAFESSHQRYGFIYLFLPHTPRVVSLHPSDPAFQHLFSTLVITPALSLCSCSLIGSSCLQYPFLWQILVF